MNLAGITLEEVTGVCEEHGEWKGEFLSFAVKHASCPKCSENRKVQEEQERRNDLARNIFEARLNSAAIPKRFREKVLKSYQPCAKSQKIYHACVRYSEKLEWVQENGTSLILCGKPGTGKTHLSIGILQESIRKGISSRYATVIEMIRDVKDTYSRGSEKTEKQVIDYYSNVAILVLDEVGMQIGSDTEKLILSEIINNRYSGVKPTILISNLGMKELKEYLGDRIFDRMKEGGGTVFNFDWESKRGSI